MEDELDLDVKSVIEEITSEENGGYQDFPWYLLGIFLGMKKDTLDTLERQHPKVPNHCLMEMIDTWIKSDSTASWLSLACGIKNLGMLTLAKNIAANQNLKIPDGANIDFSTQDEEVTEDDAMRAKIIRKDQQISQGRTQLDKTIRFTEEIESLIHILQKEIEEAILEMENITLKNEILNKSLEEKIKQSHVLSEYLKRSPDKNMESLLKEVNEEIRKMTTEIAENVKMAEAKKTEVERKGKEAENRKKEVLDLQLKIETSKESISKLEKSLAAITKELERMQKERDETIEEKNEELAKKLQKLSQIQQHLCNTDKTIKELWQERKKLKRQISIYQAELARLRAQRSQNKEKIKVITEKIVQLTARYNKIIQDIEFEKPVPKKELHPFWCEHWQFHCDHLCDSCKESLEKECKEHDIQGQAFILHST